MARELLRTFLDEYWQFEIQDLDGNTIFCHQFILVECLIPMLMSTDRSMNSDATYEYCRKPGLAIILMSLKHMAAHHL